MADEGTPKSAFELAMARLRKKDAEDGVSSKPLTDSQKAAIAEVRSFYGSKLAEQDILRQAALRRTFDPAEVDAIDQRFRRERERLTSERDAKIERIRAETPDA